MNCPFTFRAGAEVTLTSDCHVIAKENPDEGSRKLVAQEVDPEHLNKAQRPEKVQQRQLSAMAGIKGSLICALSVMLRGSFSRHFSDIKNFVGLYLSSFCKGRKKKKMLHHIRKFVTHFVSSWGFVANVRILTTAVSVVCIRPRSCLGSGLLIKLNSLLAHLFDRGPHRSDMHLEGISETIQLIWHLWCISFSFGWSVLQWCHWTHVPPSGLCTGAVWVRYL